MNTRLTALIVASALFMENMDSTVIATSLPAIAADLGTDPIKLKLALTSYLLSLATFIPISGWTADRFGARTVFRAAIAVFMVGSIACSLSHSIGWFVMARIVQGMGGAMMTPVGRLVVLRTAKKSEILNAMAWLTMPALLGPMLGPPLGGFITTYASWRWIFWINIPVGFVGIGLVSLFIQNTTQPGRTPLDRVGFVLSGIGLGGFVFGLSVLGQNMMPLPVSIGMVVTGLVSIALYLRHARGHPAPLLDLDLLKLPTFRTSILAGNLFRIGIGAIPFLLPLSLQLGLGMTPFQSGSLTFLAAVGAFGMKFTATPIVNRFGFKRVLIVNGLISSAMLLSIGMFSFGIATSVMVVVLLAGGFFRSLQFTSLNAIAYSDVDHKRMSRATSLYSVGQQISLAIGVAVAAGVLEGLRFARAGQAIHPTDFFVAFVVVTAISLLAIPFYIRLHPDAGAAVAGRRRAQREESAADAGSMEGAAPDSGAAELVPVASAAPDSPRTAKAA